MGARCQWTWPKLQRGLGSSGLAAGPSRPSLQALGNKPGGAAGAAQRPSGLSHSHFSQKPSLQAWGKPSPTLPGDKGALSRERGARPPAHLLPALASEQPGQPWQAGPLPAGAGARGAEQGPWCLALSQSRSSRCHHSPDTAVPRSAPLLPPPLLPQQLWSPRDCSVAVVLCNRRALGPL